MPTIVTRLPRTRRTRRTRVALLAVLLAATAALPFARAAAEEDVPYWLVSCSACVIYNLITIGNFQYDTLATHCWWWACLA